MSDPRLHTWDNPRGRRPDVPVPRVTWLTPLVGPGCTIPSPTTLAKCGTSAAAPVIEAATVRAAARAISGALPTKVLVGALTDWAVGQDADRLDVAPVTVALLATHCDLTDEQVADVMASCRPGLPPLSDDMLLALMHALGTSRRTELTRLLARAGADRAAWLPFHETGRRLALAEPTRVAATAEPQHWAALVARRAAPAEIGDPRWAQLLETARTPTGRSVSALRTDATVARVVTDWDVTLDATTGRPSDATLQPFTVHDPDGGRAAAGVLELAWDGMRIVALRAPGGDSVPAALADDLNSHVSRLRCPAPTWSMVPFHGQQA